MSEGVMGSAYGRQTPPPDYELTGIVNLSRGGILLPSVARRFGAEKDRDEI